MIKIERQELLDTLRPLVSEGRYQHILSVEKTAIKLAQIHNANVEKAALAALLHDCAKNISKDPEGPEAFSKRHHIDEYLHNYDDVPMPVLHAPMGAHMARVKFGVEDEEILSAITWHTSGKPDMSLMDKVIFIADYTEPIRPSTPQLEEVRELSLKDLDKALLKALEYSIEHIKAKGKPIYDYTLNAYEFIKNQLGE